MTFSIIKNRSLVRVPLAAIGSVWPYVSEWILEANRQANELDDWTILERLLEGRMHLFVVENPELTGALTVEIQHWPARTIAQIVHLGGTFKSMVPLLPELESFARSEGATALREHGRRGWTRELQKHGFGFKYHVMEKEL